MEKSEYRVLIKHYFLRGKTLSKSKAKLDKYYLHSALSHGMVQKWFTEFRCGRKSTEIIPSPGCPNEINTPEIISKIHYIVLNDPKVEVHEIVKIGWVLRLLRIDQKRIRVTTSEQNLA